MIEIWAVQINAIEPSCLLESKVRRQQKGRSWAGEKIPVP